MLRIAAIANAPGEVLENLRLFRRVVLRADASLRVVGLSLPHLNRLGDI
jgi:hypothetical protein